MHTTGNTPDPATTTSLLCVSISGGKDSAATALHLRERGLPFRCVFMDTGWEHRDTYAYIRGPLTDALGEVTWIRSEVTLTGDKLAAAEELEGLLGHYSAMVRYALHKGMMPSRLLRWCTSETKVRPVAKWCDSLDTEVVNVVGIRNEESAARADLGEWEWSDDFDRWTWRPIIRWTLQDVIDIHARHGLAPNPLYLRGAERVGCWPCIFARKAEIRFIADTDPVRIEVIRRLEAHVARFARERIEAAGKAQKHTDPTWFQADRATLAADGRTGWWWPIDNVVEWSRTSRGGKQMELFAASPRDAGCVRWGLCDTAPVKRR